MNIICLDIEFTDAGEILEVSFISYPDMKVIYHSLFKPKAKTWEKTLKIHNISPEMVADAPGFAEERRKVQQIVDSSDMLITFAAGNDIGGLRRHGIKINDQKPVVDVQQLFIINNRHLGYHYGKLPGLDTCAEQAGLSFSDEKAHRATYDTEVTLRLFEILIQEYNGGRIHPNLCREIEDKLRRQRAKGIVKLIPAPEGGYKIKTYAYVADTRNVDGEIAIEVESRFLAEHQLRKKFARREDRHHPGIFLLRKSDIEFFSNYKNSYDPVQEQLCNTRYGDKKKDSNLHFKMK